MGGKLVSLQIEQDMPLLCGKRAGGWDDPMGRDWEKRALLTGQVKMA